MQVNDFNRYQMLKYLKHSEYWLYTITQKNNHFCRVGSVNRYQFTTFPFNTIGWISLTSKDSNSLLINKYGVGFQVSNSLVLSSSNNFVSIDEKRNEIRQYNPTLFTCMLTDEKGNKITQSSQIEQFKVNVKYLELLNKIAALKKMRSNQTDKNSKNKYSNQIELLQSEAIQHDYALLKLVQPFEKSHCFQICPNLSLQQKIVISGYLHQQKNEVRLVTRSNNLNSIGKGRMYYDIDIPTDFSGAPVYLYKNISKLVGIHTSNLHNKRLNVGTMVTQSMIEVVKKWEKEMTSSITMQNSTIQEAQQLYNIGTSKLKENQFDEALHYLTRSLNIQQKLKGKDSQGCIGPLMGICCVIQQKGNFEEIMNTLYRILSIYEKIYGKESLKCIDTHFCIAEMYENNGKIDEAIESLKIVVSIYEKQKDKKLLKNGAICSIKIGNHLYQIGKYDQSIEYYKKVLQITENVEGKDHMNFGWANKQIGLIHSHQERFSEALEYLNRAMNIYQKNKSQESIEYANVLHSIGIVYNNEGKFNEALKNYSYALRIKQRVKGKDSIYCVVTLDCIGYIHKTLGDEKMANEFFEKAKRIKKAHQNSQ